MKKTFTFLLYLACFLMGMAYPANQYHEDLIVIYALEGTTIVKEEKIAGNQEPANITSNIITIPQLPPAEVYTPNSIKGFKTANPAENITLINAPVPNASGNAVLQFNMKLPEGRAGMMPDLGISYNNESGNGWMGYGWTINMPSVGIETRWGSPRYDPALETEMYTLNGELLSPMNNRSELVARAAE